MVTFWHWYVCTGRTARRTFWLRYVVPILGLSLLAQVIDAVRGNSHLQTYSSAEGGTFDAGFTYNYDLGWMSALAALLLLAPSLSSQVTRLHDRGHSAWWLLFALLPLAGPIVLIVQYALPGDAGPNRFGLPAGTRISVPDAAYSTGMAAAHRQRPAPSPGGARDSS